MIDWGLMGGIYAAFHATHGLADYWLQTDHQAQNKSKSVKALLHHVVGYSLSFMPVAWALEFSVGLPLWKALLLPLIVGIPHGWMDRRRFLTWFCTKTKGWSQDDIPKLTPVQAAVRVHVTIHMDQKFHYACLLLTAAWLAWK